MMSPFSREDLKTKINQAINRELAQGHAVETAGIVNHMITKVHVPPTSQWNSEDDRAEAIFVIREGYRQIVNAVVRARKQEETEPSDPQYVLPGYERLQKVYSIGRLANDGDIVETLVPIEQCSKAELLMKRAQLVHMRNGLDKHIEELDRWISARWPVEENLFAEVD